MRTPISSAFLFVVAALGPACVSDETLDETQDPSSSTASGGTSTSGSTSEPTTSATTSSSDQSSGQSSDASGENSSGTSSADPLACTPGTQVPAADNCNTCECPASGRINEATACTEADCGCTDNTSCKDWAFCKALDHECKFDVGQCKATPELCDDGGTGACGCDGTYYLNECEANAHRSGVNALGGCEPSPGIFQCGATTCMSDEQYCNVQYNDVAGPEQPVLFANCVDLPAACNGVPSCECLNVPPPNRCEVIQTHVFAVYLGG